MKRSEIEKMLRVGDVKGLPMDFVRKAKAMAAQFIRMYSVEESPYEMDERIVFNRVCNLMVDALSENPNLTPKEFEEMVGAPFIFYDWDAICTLEQLAAQDESGEYFEIGYYFFALKIFSFVNQYSICKKYLQKREAVTALYSQVHFELKRCGEKNCHIDFKKKLYLIFKATMNEIMGKQGFPTKLPRNETELYLRFRAEVTKVENRYEFGECAELTEKLGVSETKIQQYWQIYSVVEITGVTPIMSHKDDDEDGGVSAEHVGDASSDDGYNGILLDDLREKYLDNEAEKKIFDILVANGDGMFSRSVLDELGVTRYQVNKVKAKLRDLYIKNNWFRPIE